MNLCSKKHDEVCYESGDCPACTLLDEISDLKGEVQKLKKEIENIGE